MSIVVVTRNGLQLLRGLTDGLVLTTDYPRFELIVADNGSVDGTAEWVESAELPFDITLDRSEHNRTFSQANNDAARLARGDLLLFLNNDVEPMEGGWLTELVGALQEGICAVGATLVHGTVTDPDAASGWIVQHRGIGFRSDRGAPRAFNLDDGEDVFSGTFGTDRACPAVTAACLLVKRDLFESVQGFPIGYRYGSEDVELGLLLTRRGLAFAAQAALSCCIANPPPRVRKVASSGGSTGRRIEMSCNSAGRRSSRASIALTACKAAGSGLTRGPHVAITVTSPDAAAGWGDWYTAHELGDALAELGWRIDLRRAQGRRLVRAARRPRLPALPDGPLRPGPRAGPR